MTTKTICIYTSMMTLSGVVATFVLHRVYPNHSIIELIGIIGSIASFTGVIIALFQIRQADEEIKIVGNVARATQTAVAENRNEIKQFLTFSEIGQLVEMVKAAQNHLVTKNYNAALIKLQDIKDNLVRTYHEHHLKERHKEEQFYKYIKSIGKDIDSLAKYNIGNEDDGFDIVETEANSMHHNLEVTREILIEIESIIKRHKL